MDINTVLENARRALVAYREAEARRCTTKAEIQSARHDSNEAADNLADAFGVLDGWLSRGGFLPYTWFCQPATEIEGE